MVFPEGVPFHTPFVKVMTVKCDSSDINTVLQWLDPGEKITITYESGGVYRVEFFSFILRVEHAKANLPTNQIYDIM